MNEVTIIRTYYPTETLGALFLFLSLSCSAQFVTSTAISYSKDVYYGFDIRYIQDEGIQQLHYSLKYQTNTNDEFATLSIAGFNGKALKWGAGFSLTKYKENVSASFNPLLSYQRKRLFTEMGTLIRVTYYGEDRNKWNHFITVGWLLK